MDHYYTGHRRIDSGVSAEEMAKMPQPYAEHGAMIDRSRAGDAKPAANAGLRWPRFRHIFREAFSEFMGTFILVLFGDGAIAQVVLSDGAKGNYQSIAWGWGLGAMLGVYTAGISGAHINPAVTLANCVFRNFPWRKFPIYAASQVLGAFCAAGVVYGNYKSAIDAYEGGASIRTVPGYSQTATAGIFCTYPAPFMTRTGEFFSEFIASTTLMFLIYAVKDDANIGAGKLTPLAIFFVVFGIGSCFGWETGFAINLARDFGPRLMSFFLGYGHEVWSAGLGLIRIPGYGHEVWSAGGYYFWIPMIAPFLGCTFGGFLYDALLFTGQSPINMPYLGTYRFIPGMRRKFDGMTFTEEDIKEDSQV